MLCLELQEAGESGFVVDVVGELSSEGAAELDGFCQEGVGLKILGGRVFGLSSAGLCRLVEKEFGFLLRHFCEAKLIFWESEPGNCLPLAHQRLLEYDFSPRRQ